MSIYIVTDLGYGDSGKGTTVDYLARQGKSLVVRHNGGPQAGHNVVLPDGTHHEFSQFGAGTFAGADTYLSRFMLVNPIDMRKERAHLYDLHVIGEDVYRRTHVDEECRIITPWHIAINRLMGYSNGESCGRGIGELMRQDIDHPELTIRVKDIRRDGLIRKLDELREYLARFRYRVLPSWSTNNPDAQLFNDEDLPARLAREYYTWYNNVNVVGGQWLATQFPMYDHVIFEGAQGVLLDEWYGFHPYTTWSTTTHENALTVLKENNWDGEVTRLGVTRAYMTRHGAGPFVTEDKSVQYDEPHNSYGVYQGGFRQGHLDLVALDYAIRVCGGVDGLVVTHLDRANTWKIAGSYRAEYFKSVHGIMVNPDREDLKWQGKLTDLLMNTTASYSSPNGVSEGGLLAILNHIAPIHITSRGPTHADKEWLS